MSLIQSVRDLFQLHRAAFLALTGIDRVLYNFHCPFKILVMAKRNRQLELELPTWGGKRKNAGRKRKAGARKCVAHRPRPKMGRGNPVHTTLRARRDVRGLRHPDVFGAIKDAIRSASRPFFRIVHFSVQGDHIHLIIEATDRDALILGMRGLTVRLARAINRATGDTGKVWGDRYHVQPLTSPRQIRNTLLYVLANWRKHFHVSPRPALDPCSSAAWFDGWLIRPPDPDDDPPVVQPRTWLLTRGWRRHGLLSPADAPGPRA
jgi:putative transposase